MKLPNCSRPCADCPFRKDSLKAWLGAERAKEVAQSDTFTCHKTKDPTRLQCAGHMLLMGEKNAFVSLEKAMQIDLNLSGKELIFETEQDFISHHKI